MHDNEVRVSNAVTLAQYVALVAVEVARTGLDVASINVTRAYGHTTPVHVDVQALTEDDALVIAGIFPGLPTTSRYHGGNVDHQGTWTGQRITVNVYAAADTRVTA